MGNTNRQLRNTTGRGGTLPTSSRTRARHDSRGGSQRCCAPHGRFRSMRGDVVSDAVFPDYELPDHRGKRVMLRRRRVLAVSGRLGAQAAERSRHDPTTLRSSSGNLLHHIGSSTTRAICIGSGEHRPADRRYVSACALMGARRGMPTGATSTSRATARPPDSGSTSSSDSPSLLPIECSRSSFSIPAWRFMSLRSDEAHGWVAERLNAPDLKSGNRASDSWVRIPPHPLPG
jgi:hypothetical protein